MRWAGWTGCTECVGSPRPGARHLLAWLSERWPDGYSRGIYACRDVRGGSSRSIHACGRAVDYGFDTVDGRGDPAGHDIVRVLGEHGRRLGAQTIIFDRQIWSAQSPEGRVYQGVHPHYDHLHIELTPTSGERLTLATLRSVTEPEEDDMAALGPPQQVVVSRDPDDPDGSTHEWLIVRWPSPSWRRLGPRSARVLKDQAARPEQHPWMNPRIRTTWEPEWFVGDRLEDLP